MGPAQPHATHKITCASIQDEDFHANDSDKGNSQPKASGISEQFFIDRRPERHRPDFTESLHVPHVAECSQTGSTASSDNQPVLSTDGTHSQPHKAWGVQSASDVQSQTHKCPVVTEAHLQASHHRNEFRDSNPALPFVDAHSTDRLEEGRTAAAAASVAPATISGTSTNLARVSGFVENSDGDVDVSSVIMDRDIDVSSVITDSDIVSSVITDSDIVSSVVTDSDIDVSTGRICSWRLGHACQLGYLKAVKHSELTDTELVGCETRCAAADRCETRCAAADRCETRCETRCAAADRCETRCETRCAAADRTGLQAATSDTDGKPAVCDPELDNIEARVETSVMESRKRKRSQSGMFVVDISTSLGLHKLARVEDNCNFNNNKNSAVRIFLDQSEVPEKLSEHRLKTTGGSHRHLDDRKWILETDNKWRQLGGERGRLDVCVGPDSADTQPDLWSKMEGLCETTQGQRCASRWRIFIDAFIKRSMADRNFEPGHEVNILPSAKLACDNCQHGHMTTGSQISSRTSSQTSGASPANSIPRKSRYRFRSNSSGDSSLSRSRSHSPTDCCQDQSCVCDNCDEYVPVMCSSQPAGHYRWRCQHQPRSWLKCRRCRTSCLQSGLSASTLTSSPLSQSRYKQVRGHKSDGLHLIKQLFAPLVLPASVTTVIAAPVTGTSSPGKGNAGSISSLANSIDNKHPSTTTLTSPHPSTTTLTSPEKTNKLNGGQHVFHPNSGDKNKFESRESEVFETNSMSLPPRAQNIANSRMGGAKMESGSQEHYMGPGARSANHFGEHPDHGMQREQQRYEQHFNNVGYHPSLDHSFSEDAGYDFYGADYDYVYDEANDEYGFGNEPYPPHLHQRHPGPNTYYPRRPPPQGPRGPPQMFPSNERSYGPPRLGMGGPSSRMGPNGPVGSRGPRSPMGPRGHRPQGGPGGPLGPPVMRGPPRGSPYGPPRGSPYGPPGPMRPQGMRGPPGPGMMGQAGHGGPAGPRPRIGPPARMQSPMPRHGSQPPGGLRPRMGPPPSGPAPRDDQYMPQRPAILPTNAGDPNFCSPLPNLSQPPPNFVPSTSSLPPSTAPAAASATQIVDVVEPPPPLPPPKPPTPKPPPPPKKEEEKKEEIKPMTPLIPPEQAEQYRKLREQARKHARKQQRKQEHQAKGEPDSTDDDDDEAAKRKEYEVKLAAEREEMEKAALLAVEDNGALHYEEGAAILMPATQPSLIQQPTMMVQHHPLATQPTSYGYMPASQFLHTAHPGLHPSQLQNLQFMTSPGQPQLVQLPNGQMAYATAAPMAYQTAGPMVAMQHQAAMSAAGMPHQFFLSSGGIHQLPVTGHSGLSVSGHPGLSVSGHPGLSVSGSQYMAHVMASQVQAAQIQAAQAAQIQAAQAAQIQAAQAAQIQAAQAAQVQAAQAAQVQAAQAQAQVQSGMVPGMHMAQHVLPGIHPQGQYILVPRVARPQM